MRDENGVEPSQLFQIFRAARIGHYKGVDDRKLATGCRQAKRAVPEIGDFIALQINHELSFPKESYLDSSVLMAAS
jgi:hypothetical protein